MSLTHFGAFIKGYRTVNGFSFVKYLMSMAVNKLNLLILPLV